MYGEVFKYRGFFGIFMSFITTTIFAIILYNLFNSPFVFLIIFYSVISSVRASKKKLVIEHGNLRLENTKYFEEVSLENVSQIVSEQMETTDTDGSITPVTYMNIYDKTGQSVFEFPFFYVSSKKEQERFKNAVHAINPAIKMNFNTSLDNLKIIIKDFKEYRKSKKEEKEESHNDRDIR